HHEHAEADRDPGAEDPPTTWHAWKRYGSPVAGAYFLRRQLRLRNWKDGAMLTDDVRPLFQAPVFVVITTINPDGMPQSSVVWAKVEEDTVVISTIRGRRKCLNMERDPRVTLLAYDPKDPYRYVELRGTVTLDEA